MNLKKIFSNLFGSLCECNCKQQDSIKQTNCTNTIVQVSTLQALMQGYYYPVSTAGELKENGNFGIGCFESVNGELIMVDGVVYQAIHDSSILIPDNNSTIAYVLILKM